MAAVDYEDVAGDEGGGVGGEEDGGAFQVVVAAEAVQGNSAEEGVLVSLDEDLRHVGWEPAWSDGVHLDIVHAPFAGEILGENDDAAFAGVIADGLKFGRSAAKSGDARNVNNFSAALGDHGFADGLGKKKCAGEVGLDDFVPVLQAHFFDGRAPGGSGIVDEDVDAAEGGEGGVDDGVNVGGIFHVAGQR